MLLLKALEARARRPPSSTGTTGRSRTCASRRTAHRSRSRTSRPSRPSRPSSSRLSPAHDFLGEETGRSGADAEYLWLIDPIDGTKSFIAGYPFFSTQIALMRNSQVVLGVSCASEFGAGELAWAERGQGAWLDDERLRVSDVASVAECTLSIGNQRTLARGPRWAKLGTLVAEANRVRGYGDFYHYHLLAAGKIDAVIETDVNVLDIAALSVIVEEAGGRFTDLEGRPVSLETSSVLATNGRLHDAILSRLR
jgi:histidinol-phosphatase